MGGMDGMGQWDGQQMMQGQYGQFGGGQPEWAAPTNAEDMWLQQQIQAMEQEMGGDDDSDDADFGGWAGGGGGGDDDEEGMTDAQIIELANQLEGNPADRESGGKGKGKGKGKG